MERGEDSKIEIGNWKMENGTREAWVGPPFCFRRQRADNRKQVVIWGMERLWRRGRVLGKVDWGKSWVATD